MVEVFAFWDASQEGAAEERLSMIEKHGDIWTAEVDWLCITTKTWMRKWWSNMGIYPYTDPTVLSFLPACLTCMHDCEAYCRKSAARE